MMKASSWGGSALQHRATNFSTAIRDTTTAVTGRQQHMHILSPEDA